MKTNELKIKNLVLDINGNITEVESINSIGINLRAGDGNSVYPDYEFEFLKPIKLNDEWFISCQSNSVFNNGFSYRKTNTGRYDIFCGSMYITVIEFVHELQNLNFALLGEELIFNKEYL